MANLQESVLESFVHLPTASRFRSVCSLLSRHWLTLFLSLRSAAHLSFVSILILLALILPISILQKKHQTAGNSKNRHQEDSSSVLRVTSDERGYKVG